jgi:hypothetical protein
MNESTLNQQDLLWKALTQIAKGQPMNRNHSELFDMTAKPIPRGR